MSHYVIQRSTNGKDYSDVAILFANNASGTSTYKYKDANVTSSTNVVYYRLLMIDNAKEGGNYSPTRIINRCKETQSLKLTTYPNPVTEQVRVTLPSAWQVSR